MKAKHLQFNPVDEAPTAGFTCNTCGHKYTQSQWRMADIPVHDGKDTVSVVVCSKRCLHNFINHPDADRMLTDLVARVEKMQRPEPTEDDYTRLKDLFRGMGVKLIKQKAQP